MRPVDVVRLLNSRISGAIDSSKLARHRSAAGYRIGDGETVDLVRYIAWLRISRSDSGPTAYEAQKIRAAERQRRIAAASREIGEIPAVADQERRDRCRLDLRLFCETYLSRVFYLPWSKDHQRIVAAVQSTVLNGGQQAMAMPRGFGKTAISEGGTLWSMMYGHRHFIVVVGPDIKHAEARAASFRVELESNDLFLVDFPEVCYPIRRLEGITQRRLLYRGRQIKMELTEDRIVLPSIPGAASAGTIVATAGITGQIRGLQYKREDGSAARPDLVIIDDPQTEESANSPSQCDFRERTINGAILGLGGPDRRLAAIMPCTVIVQGDLTDRILDRERNPQWRGERTKLIYQFPTNEDLWRRYADMRRDGMRLTGDGRSATEFYAANRAAMDEGAIVAWPEFRYADEASALQAAMNIKIDRHDRAFFAEYQNEPLPEDRGATEQLDAAALVRRINGRPRGVVPGEATHLTAFVDIQSRVLYWMVCAWQDDFTGYVVDYGTEPKQPDRYFDAATVRRTLAMMAPKSGMEGAIYAGLERFAASHLATEWKTEGGASVRIERCLVDANWGPSTDTTYLWAKQTPHAAVVLPSHGHYVGASSAPFATIKQRPGDRVGLDWKIPLVHQKRQIRHVTFDTNSWKSFVRARLHAAIGDPASITLFGRDEDAHRLLADHFTAEYSIQTVGRGRVVDEWKETKGRDNHWWDCIVGNAVAASIQGVRLGTVEAPRAPKKRVRWSELYGKRAAV